jgi:hypothetical protein
MQEVLVRGLVQAPVPGAQRLDKITRFRKSDPLLERDVNVPAAVGREILNPPRTAGMQPCLDGPNIGFDPVNTGDGRVKVKENRSACAVLAKDAHSSRKGGKLSRQGSFMFLRKGLSPVAGKTDAGLPGKQES